MKIESWLPVFPGFYGTEYDDLRLDNDDLFNDYRKIPEDVINYIQDNLYYHYNNNERMLAVVNLFIKEFNNVLKENNIPIKFNLQKIVSPKEYNFTNDSINVEIIISKKYWKKILSDLKNKYRNEFSKYLIDHYTSRSGFCSFYSHDIEIWLSELEDPTNKDMINHRAGSMIDFYLNVIDLDIDNSLEHHLLDETIYSGNVYDTDYINDETLVAAINEKFNLSIKTLRELEVEENA